MVASTTAQAQTYSQLLSLLWYSCESFIKNVQIISLQTLEET